MRLQDLLKGAADGPLDRLLRRAAEVDRLTGALRAGLSAELAAELQTANLRDDGELVLVVRSPAWAARLRFESRQLIAAAKGCGAQATSCRVIVSHDNPRSRNQA